MITKVFQALNNKLMKMTSQEVMMITMLKLQIIELESKRITLILDLFYKEVMEIVKI